MDVFLFNFHHFKMTVLKYNSSSFTGAIGIKLFIRDILYSFSAMFCAAFLIHTKQFAREIRSRVRLKNTVSSLSDAVLTTTLSKCVSFNEEFFRMESVKSSRGTESNDTKRASCLHVRCVLSDCML